MRKGYIYILSNPAMPGLVKIGQSAHGGRKRAKEIDQTGVPSSFVLEFEILTENYKDIEIVVHERLDYCRESGNREFFRVAVGSAISEIINSISKTHIMSDAELIVDEVDVAEMTLKLSKQGINIDHKTVALSFFYIDPAAVLQAVKKFKKVKSDRIKHLKLVTGNKKRA